MSRKKTFFGVLGLVCMLASTYLLLRNRSHLEDYSVSKVIPVDRPYKVHLVSYAAGPEVNYRNQNALLQSAINKGIDIFHLYNFNHLDADFKKKNAHILSQKRGAGYWLWKPYVILSALKKADEGDIIIYIDSGIYIKKNIDKIIRQVEQCKFDIVLRKNSHDNTVYMKRDLLKYFNMDTDEYRKKTHIDASVIILRNSGISRAFIEEWLDICEHENLLTDTPCQEEYPTFRDHRHDQAILTLLSYKYSDTVFVDEREKYDDIFEHHRRRENKKDRSLLGKIK